MEALVRLSCMTAVLSFMASRVLSMSVRRKARKSYCNPYHTIYGGYLLIEVSVTRFYVGNHLTREDGQSWHAREAALLSEPRFKSQPKQPPRSARRLTRARQQVGFISAVSYYCRASFLVARHCSLTFWSSHTQYTIEQQPQSIQPCLSILRSPASWGSRVCS